MARVSISKNGRTYTLSGDSVEVRGDDVIVDGVRSRAPWIEDEDVPTTDVPLSTAYIAAGVLFLVAAVLLGLFAHIVSHTW